MDDTDSERKAKQRASVKWILSKAFNNRVPENLREPFYKDHEGQDHLKPQIVVGLGNASLYAQVLTNIYSDPNYQNSNHWSILQVLNRKGCPVKESPKEPLTETILIQTNPLKINAHMSVIESVMNLYAKEVTSSDRVAAAIGRISGGSLPPSVQNYEAALICWISHACAALKKRIDQEVATGGATDENGQRLESPDIPPIREIKDLCDGVCLAFLICYYCPKIVPWSSVRVNYLPTVEDSLHNCLILSNFSQKFLPYSVFHMTAEDITYMRGSMKPNLIVLLADLFNLLEIHPAKCVSYPGMDQYVNRSASAITMRKQTPPRDNHNDMMEMDEGFVVHKSRGVPTLNKSMQEPLVPARIRQAKEKTNNDSKADERGDNQAAGRPSNWEEQRRPSFAGRRSRRNSITDDSQLTIENFGGSQDHLNMIGRAERERERKISSASIEPTVALRSSKADARGSIQFGYDTDSGSEKQDRESEKYGLRRQGSVDNVSLRSAMLTKEKDLTDGEVLRSFTTVNPLQYVTSDDEVPATNTLTKRKTATFATLANNNTTTWQQQQMSMNAPQYDDGDESQVAVDASKLSSIRMKLEEKRRNIEAEKRRIEAEMSKQLQKVGKAAFLQAINKGKGDNTQNVDEQKSNVESAAKPERPCSLQDITGDNIDSNWNLRQAPSLMQQQPHKKTPDSDHVDLEAYQQSIAAMNSNLHDMQADIQRLVEQQNQIQAQTMQAQQLMQAQQIASLLNQQYGSQHNIPGGYRPINQPNFGSTPHLSQQQQQQQQPPHTAPGNFTMRPPSRDPVIQPIQFINEQGIYIPNSNNHNNSQFSYSRENSQTQFLGGGGDSNNSTSPYYNRYQGSQQQYFQDTNHYREQPQQSQFMDGTGVTNQFYLHDGSSTPTPPPRRTWAQQAANNSGGGGDVWSQSPNSKFDSRTWKSPSSSGSSQSGNGGGFLLHQNGGNDYQDQNYGNLFQVHSSPQTTRMKQLSQIMSGGGLGVGNQMGYDQTEYREPRMAMSPPIDDMPPQVISFIGDEEEGGEMELNTSKVNLSRQFSNVANRDLANSLSNMNITSGNLTYRKQSPTRPILNQKSFQNPQNETAEKGFYISFDNEQPKRPKPPLRTKRSPKKEKSFNDDDDSGGDNRSTHHRITGNNNTTSSSHNTSTNNNNFNTMSNNGRTQYEESPIMAKKMSRNESERPSFMERQQSNNINTNTYQSPPSNKAPSGNSSNNNNNNSSNIYATQNYGHAQEPKALIIGAQLSQLDPNDADEMERKKEKIMLLSLQRRQQQEEAKAQKEIEAMRRREREQEKEDEKARKKEEMAARRAIILEQHRLKKAVEEAEREGKSVDQADLRAYKQIQQQMQHQQSLQAPPKLRQNKNTRPRPKTIHVESGSIDLSDASSLASRGKRGSNSNLTGVGLHSSNSMRRDYYRGSQDSLAIREPAVERGRTMSRISIANRGANFRGRKSNSLMNLCDSDSGLGRATPPRRAPSPGMGSSRHLPSPSGPGSLPPGLITKRRVFDDGSSDISTASSMMEYHGPRIYKQPATKSNRNIILNAVEYCVFPGVVNRDAKQKVLEKIARSEAKHFLVLFRDAGCQFRALYSYCPEIEQISKLYGTGPSQVDELMFDKFFKYNSGGKCFTQVHTKHLTVTIDAFTIHNALWQGKKVNLPSKKDMALVI